MHRDLYSTASSQFTNYENIKTFNQAVEEIVLAYKYIYTFLSTSQAKNIIPVSYESLVFKKEDTLKGLSKILGLELKSKTKITNENRKWYDYGKDINTNR